MAGEDKAYIAWIHTLGCAAAALGGCQGRIEAHHAGRRGLGQRAHDRTAIPLCTYHHRCWEDASGAFRTWDQSRRREWIADWLARLARAHEYA